VEWGADTPDFYTGAIELEDFKGLDIEGLQAVEAPNSTSPVISLSRGGDVSIRNSKAGPGTRVFLSLNKVTGARVFSGNDVGNAQAVFAGDSSGFQRYGNFLPKRKSTLGSSPH
jgi:hypothetical protein